MRTRADGDAVALGTDAIRTVAAARHANAELALRLACDGDATGGVRLPGLWLTSVEIPTRPPLASRPMPLWLRACTPGPEPDSPRTTATVPASPSTPTPSTPALFLRPLPKTTGKAPPWPPEGIELEPTMAELPSLFASISREATDEVDLVLEVGQGDAGGDGRRHDSCPSSAGQRCTQPWHKERNGPSAGGVR